MSLNVLIVDDSPVMRKMVRRSLGMCGLPIGEIHEAGNGREALALLARQWVDVVIADINMPEMGGVEMVEHMAKDGLLARLPVVMVSSDRSEERVEHLKALGVRAYLSKPFKPEMFREVVEELLPVGPTLKAEPTPALLGELTASALEECAFVMARPSPDSIPWPEEVVRATMGFDGPAPGRLGLTTSAECGAELAANMLGVDPDDPDVEASVEAALAELANILCGVLVERIFGREASCKLGLPQVAHGSIAESRRGGGVSTTLVDDEGRAYFVALELSRAAPRAIPKFREVM